NSPSSSSPSSEPSTPSTPSIPSEVSPDVSPDVTPIVSPDVSPDISPDITPTESTDVTPAESTDITPTDSQDVIPTPGPDPYNPGGDEQNDGDSPSSAYSLTSAAQIINLINRLLNGLEAGGKYYIINADLDFSDVTDWQPIGSAAHPFSGHFNGGGHTITYNGGGGGLFGVVSSDGTAIQDLNVVVSRTRNGSALDKGASPAPTDYAGGIVQELVSGVIDGCTFSGPVSASGENTSAGGIVGELSGGTVQNCKVLDGSTIRATLSAGGIAGYVSEGRISGCTSDAEVDAEYSGGIAGYSETERGNISNNDFSKADLEVGNDEVLHLTLTLTPISQSVTAGSPITPITFRVSNAAHVSMDVPNVPDSLTLSGDVFKGVTISGTIQTAGTYSFTVTFTDQDTNETVSSDVTIIVRPAGITGITITSPDTKTIKLGQEGGSFSAEILAEGKAYGLVVWNAARTPGVSADISGSGMTATLTGTAEPNPDSQDRTITLTITAHDDGGRDFSDTLSVIVQGRRGPHSVPHYAFDVPEGVRSRLISLWGGEFYQFTAGEILSENWELSSSDLQILSGLGEKVLVHLPSVRPNNSGAYLLKLTLGSDVEVGAALKLYGITSGTGGNVSAGALEEQDYILLDEDGNEIDTVPESRTVYVALRLTAGRNHRSVITTPVQLSRGTIQPIEPDETLLEKIAETMNVSADQINFITEDEISDPEEPTQEMLEEVSNQNYSIIGKLNKLTVNKTGYYVFKVTLSDDLYEQIKNVRVEDLRVYSLYDENESSDIRVGASFIGGLVNTWELLTLGGEKMEFGLKEFLMVGLLDAGKGVCMYLGKILLTLLLAGCDTGLGIAGLIAVGLSAVFFASRRKR
ncbi:MAG: hypothetical protein II954_08840, partial [Synergistaceae bacterium]|nr:hypothetical protein [Synergistaceae bacterium]